MALVDSFVFDLWFWDLCTTFGILSNVRFFGIFEVEE